MPAYRLMLEINSDCPTYTAFKASVLQITCGGGTPSNPSRISFVLPASPRIPNHLGKSFMTTSEISTLPKQVGFAVEFEVMSEDSDRSDLFGRAISLDGGLLLAGAPKKHLEVPEIQLIVSTGTASEVRASSNIPPPRA